MSVQTKLTFILLSLCVGVILAAGFFSTISLDSYFHDRLVSELTGQASQTEFIVRTLTPSLRDDRAENDTSKYLRLQEYARAANLRFTMIDTLGRVIFESELPYDKLSSIENHLHRPEVQEALRNGIGTNTRHSATINIEMLYLAKRIAVPLPAGSGFSSAAIVRVAIPLTQVNAVMNDIQSKILIAGIIVLALVAGITVMVSKRFTRPITSMATIAEEIRNGNLEKRISSPSRDEFGKLASSLNGMVDKLNEDITKLKKLERVRSEFLGNVSHELRTPIFAIQGMIETLLQGAINDNEVNRDFLQRALHNTQNLNTLLGDLIEISRIESGEMKMSFRYFPIREFLEHVVAELQETARKKEIQLVLEVSGSAVEVLGDKERLKQVMVNLIENAIKYNETGGRVIVSYRRTDGTVQICVQDTGVGIPPEHVTRIFE